MAASRIKFHKDAENWKHSLHVTQDVWYYGGKSAEPVAEEQVLLQYKDTYIELTVSEARELATALTHAVDTMADAHVAAKKRFLKDQHLSTSTVKVGETK